jgi:NTP pyrophosphatase (non-canonical NTP hydrolase)
MSMIINNLLYRFNIFNKPSDINILNNYMLTTENKDTIMKNSINYNNSITLDEPKIEETTEVFQEIDNEKKELYQPKQQDTLFWCLYILNYGYNDYLQIDHNYGVKELEEKQKISKFIKENVVRIKNTNYKLTNVAIQEVLSELLTSQKETSLLCLIVMIVYYNINILIINETTKCLLEFWSNKEKIPSINSSSEESDAMTYVLYKTENGKYKLQYENIGSFQINDLKEKYVVLESYNKYIKAISNYKVEELEDMAKKFGVFDETKKYKKAELYELVGNNCKF